MSIQRLQGVFDLTICDAYIEHGTIDYLVFETSTGEKLVFTGENIKIAIDGGIGKEVLLQELEQLSQDTMFKQRVVDSMDAILERLNEIQHDVACITKKGYGDW